MVAVSCESVVEGVISVSSRCFSSLSSSHCTAASSYRLWGWFRVISPVVFSSVSASGFILLAF